MKKLPEEEHCCVPLCVLISIHGSDGMVIKIILINNGRMRRWNTFLMRKIWMTSPAVTLQQQKQCVYLYVNMHFRARATADEFYWLQLILSFERLLSECINDVNPTVYAHLMCPLYSRKQTAVWLQILRPTCPGAHRWVQVHLLFTWCGCWAWQWQLSRAGICHITTMTAFSALQFKFYVVQGKDNSQVSLWENGLF